MRLLYHISVDLLSYNMNKARSATNPLGTAMRLLTPTLLSLICGAAPALAAPPAIVTDTPITGSLVQQVLGDLGTVRVLLPQGASAHHYQMRPSDAQALQEAGLLIWTGPELTPWLDRAAGSLGDGVGQLRLLHVQGTALRSYGDGAGHDHEGHDHSHDHDHAHDHSHDHDHSHGHDHVHSGTDPHAWLNPKNGATWLAAIAEELGRADPDNAATYRDNASAAARDLGTLDAQITADLAPHAEQGFVVFHDAYGYFTDHFGLRPAMPVSPGDATTPSAARIANLRARIIDKGAACAFPEFGHDARLIATATEGSETRTGAALDPEGAGLTPGAELYGQVLTGLSSALVGCLSGN